MKSWPFFRQQFQYRRRTAVFQRRLDHRLVAQQALAGGGGFGNLINEGIGTSPHTRVLTCGKFNTATLRIRGVNLAGVSGWNTACNVAIQCNNDAQC